MSGESVCGGGVFDEGVCGDRGCGVRVVRVFWVGQSISEHQGHWDRQAAELRLSTSYVTLCMVAMSMWHCVTIRGIVWLYVALCDIL